MKYDEKKIADAQKKRQHEKSVHETVTRAKQENAERKRLLQEKEKKEPGIAGDMGYPSVPRLTSQQKLRVE